MKNKIFILSVFIMLINFIGCPGDKTKTSGVINEYFFNRSVTGEITISAYDSMNYKNYLEEAARAFEELYPGTKVNVETFSAMPEIRTGGSGNMTMQSIQIQDDPQSRTDYLNRLNTSIMSGQGADIFAMDIIPLQKFIESGNLENLEDYMTLDPAFNKSEYRQNILDASKYLNGMWFLPVDYLFNYFAYDSTLVPAGIAANFGAGKAWSTDDLFKTGVPLYDGSYKLFNATDFDRGLNGMFYQMFNENYEKFVNLKEGRANFQDGAFANLLETVRDYGQKGYIPRAITGEQSAGRVMQMMSIDAPRDRFFFKLNSQFSLLTQYLRSTNRMIMMGSAGNVMSNEDDDLVAGIQANADGSVPYRYNLAFGINSGSKNKETAWAFIKFLLSKEMQLSTNLNMTGLPLNNEARAQKAETVFSGLLGPAGMESALNEQNSLLLREYLSVMESLSDLINSYSVRDRYITDLTAQDIQFYIDGSRSAQETARVLQNKADLYLSE